MSSYFHLLTQLLLLHNSHTTNSISFSRPTQLTSPSSIPCILEPCYHHLILQQTTHINHPHFSVLHKLLLHFHSAYLNSTSQPTPQNDHQTSHSTASYVCTFQDAGLHLHSLGRQVPPTPTFRLVGTHKDWQTWEFMEPDVLQGAWPCWPQATVHRPINCDRHRSGGIVVSTLACRSLGQWFNSKSKN